VDWSGVVSAVVSNLDAIAEDRTQLLGALYEARLQLIYLEERFPTGTTPAVIARLDAYLSKALPWSAFSGEGQ
jgi:hypothetical protein